MWGYIFSLILVGLPAAYGAFELGRAADRRGVSAGATLLVYAISLAIVFGYFLPEGRLIAFPYAVVLPVALLVGLIVGGLAGFAQRRRTDPKK